MEIDTARLLEIQAEMGDLLSSENADVALLTMLLVSTLLQRLGNRQLQS